MEDNGKSITITTENEKKSKFFGINFRQSRSPTIDFTEIVKKRIPLLQWLPHYSLGYFLQDLLAGFTVGLTEIPQGIAYAIVAGLPSQYGLYSGFMGCFVYFIFGSCKDINTGPTAIMALMIQPHVSIMGPDAAVLMAFLSGCIIFVLGLLHMGFLVEFFSYPVTSGFTTAAALQIASSQLKSLLGITGKSETFLDAWKSVIKEIGSTSKWDAILGFITILCLFLTKEMRRYGSLQNKPEWSKRRNVIGKIIFLFSLARNALAVLVGTILAFILHEHGMQPFKLTGNVEGGLPPLNLPPFSTSYNGTDFSFGDMISQYSTVVAFCPLVALLEHIAIAKAFSKGKSLDATQELIALGAANIMGSLVRSMPVTGSFTRTAVNNASGVKTTAGGILTGAMVLVALGFMTSAFKFIPKSTLAAVIIVAMFYLCDFKAFVVLWRTKKLDMIPFLATLLCCLFISLEYGILIGIATNVTFVLYTSARPKLVAVKKKLPQGGVVLVVKPKDGLHFTAAEYMRETILKDCEGEQSTVVVDGSSIGYMDYTVAKSFVILVEELELREQKIIFWNFKQSVMEICTGVKKDLSVYFKEGTLDEVVEVPAVTRISNETTMYAIQ